jgi:hypothetical protein
LQINLKGYIILHFTLYSIPTGGSPTSMVHKFLRGFFKKSESLFFEEIAFNLKDDKATTRHLKEMSQLAKKLKKQVVLHS